MSKQQVFLSYGRENLEEATRLKEDLQREGIPVWWDRMIPPGRHWPFEIRQAMKRSGAVVLCLSGEAIARTTSDIYREALDAIAIYRKYGPGESFIFPVRFSECEIPPIEIDGVRTLDQLQHVDLFPSDQREQGIERLIDELKQTLGIPSDSEPSKLKWKIPSAIGSIVGIVLGVLPLVKDVVPRAWENVVTWTGIAIFALSFIAFVILNWQLIKSFLKRLLWWIDDRQVSRMTAIILALNIVLLSLNVLIYFTVRPHGTNPNIDIAFARYPGILYHHPTTPPYVHVESRPGSNSLTWIVDRTGAASFTYKADSSVSLSGDASSGVYMTFHKSSVDRFTYREIRFSSKAEVTCRQPDVGIRLAVDDPDAPGREKEVVKFEISSLNTHFGGKQSLTQTWQTFTIDLGDLKPTIRNQPPPEINTNLINKIAFFVNNDIAERCPAGTLWFRDVTFRSDQP